MTHSMLGEIVHEQHLLSMHWVKFQREMDQTVHSIPVCLMPEIRLVTQTVVTAVQNKCVVGQTINIDVATLSDATGYKYG